MQKKVDYKTELCKDQAKCLKDSKIVCHCFHLCLSLCKNGDDCWFNKKGKCTFYHPENKVELCPADKDCKSALCTFFHNGTKGSVSLASFQA